jgi:hypothetical protein|tara:strand:- start:530 stop:712 length:183 start_codon:yes stop_codon:yes gene_type:complete
MRHWVEVRGKHIDDDEYGLFVAYDVEKLGIIEAVSQAIKYKEKEEKKWKEIDFRIQEGNW